MPTGETTSGQAVKARVAVYIVAAGLALNGCVAVYGLLYHPALNSDFLAFWSFPRFAAAQKVAGLYDAAQLQAFQQALYPGFHSFYPFLYPPTLLLVTWWLNAFPFAAAQTIWTVAGMAVLVAAGAALFPARKWAVAAMLACPAALITGATGETAFFTTALLLGGVALLPARPVLAGICFGLLTLKPQLGVLVPFALLALGAWRTIGAAAVTALALVALSCVAFPPALWLVWARTLPDYQSAYFAAAHALNLNIIITPAANLVTLGCGAPLAWAVQVACGAGIAAAVFGAFRRAPYRLAAGVLFAGMFLAVPHAYAYDSIPLIATLALAWEAANPPWWLVILGLTIFLGPVLLLTQAAKDFLYALPESLLFLAMIRLALGMSSVEAARRGTEPYRIRS